MKFLLDNWYLIALALGSGAMVVLPMLKQSAAGGQGLSPSAAVNLMNRERAQVIDVCEKAEFDAGHIGQAKHIPLAELEAKLPAAVKNKTLPVILVCASGMRSAKALAVAKKLGYEKSYSLDGGLSAWKAANYPVEKSAA